jgi:hypothetical protein
MKLYIVIPDVHDTPPERLSRKVYHPAYRCVEEVIKAYKPHGIINLGDTADIASLSHFDIDKRKLMEGRRYQKDIDSINHLLDRQQSLSKETREYHYIIGNHEYRVERYVEYHSEAIGMMDFVDNTNLIKRGYNVVKFNDTLKIGKGRFMHGYDASANHASKMSRVYDTTIYYGHVHDVSSHSFVSPVDKQQVRIAQSLGCLCDMNPHYLQNKPNKWVNAFGMYWVQDNGNFQMDTKIIIKGETIVNGKVFKG